jgi:translation initiation factor IF-3
VRLISETGEQLGVMKTEDAIARAMDVGQDLIEVAPNAKPPVAKILNYGKLNMRKRKKPRPVRKNNMLLKLKNCVFVQELMITIY